MLLMVCQVHTPVSRYLSTSQAYRRLYSSFAIALYILQTGVILAKKQQEERSVKEPLVCFPPSFVSVLLDDVL